MAEKKHPGVVILTEEQLQQLTDADEWYSSEEDSDSEDFSEEESAQSSPAIAPPLVGYTCVGKVKTQLSPETKHN